MKYKIVIEETVAQEFEVEADSKEQALEEAKQNYYNCNFVLEPGEVQYKQMAVVDNDIDEYEWIEF
jgi:hypothetical protein